MQRFSLTFFVLLTAFAMGTPAEASRSQRETPVVAVVREWAPSVVNIGTEQILLLQQHPYWGAYGNRMDALIQNYLRSHVSAVKAQSIGSGVIVREDGLIATNAHVIQMASKIYVQLSDGKSAEASVIGVNQTDDIALIQIRVPEKLKSVRLAAQDDIYPGETAIAIGNPLGLENSVSVGVISGKNRGLQSPSFPKPMAGLIQTDAAINVGNSGGALLNLDGELIGLNLAVVEHAENIGFAIPAYKIKAMLDEYDQLMENRKNAGAAASPSPKPEKKSKRVPVQ